MGYSMKRVKWQNDLLAIDKEMTQQFIGQIEMKYYMLHKRLERLKKATIEHLM